MNKTYGLIWNPTRQTWVAAPEHARRHGKRGSVRLTALAAALLLGGSAWATGPAQAPGALPTGGQVVAGQASITQAGAQMNVLQTSSKAILNWQSFNIGADAHVQFQQPSASAVALNRVLGSDPSAIFGRLSANGQVFLVNPNGVLFAPGARVDVGGLVASSLQLSDDDFLAGRLRFTREGSTAAVLNAGEIQASSYAALLAPEVRNEGVIQARAGTVALAAGEAVTLNLSGQQLVDLQVERATVDTLVENRQLVQADGGMVLMSAQSAHALLGRVVNTGQVAADGIEGDGGTLRLSASRQIELGGQLSANAGTRGQGGTVLAIADLGNAGSRINVNARLQARGGSAGGNGGFIETSGSTVQVGNGAQVDTRAPLGRTGQWLLDPLDFTIAAFGGNITGTALGNALASSDVTIQTLDTQTMCTGAACSASPAGGNGDIFVNDVVSWSSARTLTLSAWRNVHINAPIQVLGNGGALALEIAQAGATFDFPAGIYTVSAPVTLAAGTGFSVKTANDGPALAYTVIRDAAGLAAVAADLNGLYVLGQDIAAPGSSWVPLGTRANPFGGSFDGLGNQITGLSHSNAADDTDVGLFGATSILGLVQNLSLTNVNIAGSRNVGAFVGHHLGVLSNTHASGSVTGNASSCVGGGSCTVAVGSIGGLVGFGGGGSQVLRSGSAVHVAATVGDQAGASGSGKGGVGGVVGTLEGNLFGSYASGSVQGLNAVGGLAGDSVGGTIAQSYSRAAVGGLTNTGGLVGRVQDPNFFMPLIVASFWDTAASGQASSGGGSADVGAVGLGTAQMQSPATYTAAGWDTGFDWELRAGQYPLLKALLQPVFVRADDKTASYTGSAYTGFSYTSSRPGVALGGTASYATTQGGTPVAPINVGSYSVLPGGLSVPDPSDPRGWRIEYLPGTLTIDPAVLTVITGSLVGTVSKVYDGSSTVTGLTPAHFSLSGWQGNDGATVTQTTGSFTDGPNASSSGSRLVTVSLSAGDFTPTGSTLLSNYSLPASVSGHIGSITPKTVTVTAGKVYDASTTLAQVNLSTGVGNETLNYSGATAASKNVGGGNYVSALTLHDGSGLASNYRVDTSGASSHNSVNITPRTVTLSASRVFDATTTLGGSDVSLSTGIAGETLGYSGATAASKDVAANGGNFISAITLADGSGQASNYQLPTLNAATAPVTLAPRPVTVSLVGAASKVYDGTTAAPVVTELADVMPATTPGTPTLVIQGLRDFVLPVTAGQAGAAGQFDGKDAGTGMTVTYTLAWQAQGQGTALSNYVLPTTATTTGEITPRPITATLTGTVSKVYDGTQAATLDYTNFSYQVSNYVSGEAAYLRVDGTQTWQNACFETANVGSGLTVTVDVAARDYIGVGGFKASNYSFPPTLSGSIGSITPKTVTLSASRAYDTTRTLGAQDVRLDTGIAGETLGYANATASSKNVAANGSNFINAITLVDGSGRASNYQLPVLDAAHAPVTLTPLPVTVSMLGTANKVYDGTTAAPVVTELTDLMPATTPGTPTLVVQGLRDFVLPVAAGQVGVGGQFDGKDVGSGKTITYNLLWQALDPNSPTSNYVLPSTVSGSGNITPKTLTLSGLAAASKVYDGTTTVAFSGAPALRTAQAPGAGGVDDGTPYLGDNVNLSGAVSGRFESADAAAVRQVLVAGLAIDNGNYVLDLGGYTAAITPKPLTLTGLTAASKVYDGNTTVVLAGTPALRAAQAVGAGSADDGTPYLRDNVTLTGTASGRFESADVAAARQVLVNGLSLDNGNYVLTPGLTAAITPRPLTVSQAALGKVYDGSTVAALSAGTLNNLVPADAGRVSLVAGTARFADRHAGDNKAVTVTGTGLSGAGAANYTVSDPTGLSASIARLVLTVTGQTAANKTSDGTTQAQVSGGSLQGVLPGDDVGLRTLGGSFASAAVGAGITVTPNNQLTGAAAGNYSLSSPTLKADIRYATNDILEAIYYVGSRGAWTFGGASRNLSGYSDADLMGLGKAAVGNELVMAGHFAFNSGAILAGSFARLIDAGEGLGASDNATLNAVRYINDMIQRACASCAYIGSEDLSRWMMERSQQK